ncbi:MAG TPA: hemerythrin family protein [Terriglobales bacterium]
MSGLSRSLSVSIIDEEHRDIQRAVVNLMETILLGASAAKVLESAKQALEVTGRHFQHEEELLKAIGFQKLQQHAENHAKIVGVLGRVTEELMNKDSAAALRSLREYRRLLLVHLQSEDEGYRAVVNRHAAEQGIPPLPQRIRHAIPEK